MEYREIVEDTGLDVETAADPAKLARRGAQFRNIILMGVVFMLLSSASQTCSTVETIVINSVHDQYFNGTSTMGYDLLAILNGVIAGSVWVSQTVVSNIGPKNGMLFGGICYVLFVSTFLRPLMGTLFSGVVVLGIGQAILWTSQGTFLSLNSDKETIGRHASIFWALYQTSLLWGNLFFFVKVRGVSTIDDPTRYWIFGALVLMSVLGVIVTLALKYPLPQLPPRFETSLKLLGTKRILLALSTFIYIGLEQTFWSNVYDSSLGYTQQFGEFVSKSLVGLSGVLVGLGEIFGAVMFGIFESRKPHLGRDPVIVVGFIVHAIAYALVFINIPNAAPLGETWDSGFIQPNYFLALFSALLMGIGDSAFNTQIYSFLGEVYSADSVPVFALFQFVWGCTCCGAFFYATILPLYWQLLILIVVASISTLTFCKLEWDHKGETPRIIRQIVEEKEEEALLTDHPHDS